MKKIRLLLVTAPVEESRVPGILFALNQGIAGFKVVFPGKPTARRSIALTPRQTEVLREIALGMRVKEIAHRLHISGKTVETHRQNLMERLGIHCIPDLLRYALQMGVVPASWLLETSWSS